MARSTFSISHPSEMQGLLGIPGVRTGHIGTIRLNAPALPRDKVTGWEQKLNRAYHACGCGQAAAGMVIGLIGYLAWALSNPESASLSKASTYWTGFAVIVAGLLIGKVVGLAAAHRRLVATTRQIAGEWKAPPKPEPEAIMCG